MDIRQWMSEYRQCPESLTDEGNRQRQSLYHLQEDMIDNHGHYCYPDLAQNCRNVLSNNNHQVSTGNAECLTLTEEQQKPHTYPSGSKAFRSPFNLGTHEGTHGNVVRSMAGEHIFHTEVGNIRSSSMNNSQWLNFLLGYDSHSIPNVSIGGPALSITTPLPEVQAGTSTLHRSVHCKEQLPTYSSLESPNELPKGDNYHRCLECGLQFLSNADLVTHATSHTYKNPEHCPVCNDIFKDSACLFQHIKIHHENKNGHVCSYCGKVFTQQSDLNKHFEIHMKPLSDTFYETKCKFTDASAKELRVVTRVRKKTNKCYICYKMFRTTTDLSRHMMIHTGERPFRCSFCHEGFIVLHSMKAHTIKYHQAEKALVADREVTGSQNTTATDKRTALKETRNVITDNSIVPKLQCCKTKFSTLLEIQQHWLVHDEEKAYKCPHCEMSFTKRYTRTKHIMRMHTAVKPNCLDCGQEFTQFQDLIKHMKVHEEQITKHQVPQREDFNESRVEVPQREDFNESRVKVPQREDFNESRVEVPQREDFNDSRAEVLQREDFNESRVEVDNNVDVELYLNSLLSMEISMPDTRSDSRPPSPREEEILDALM